jgi:hypothetical protein
MVAGSGGVQAGGGSTYIDFEGLWTDRRQCSRYYGTGAGGELIQRTNLVFIQLPKIFVVASESSGTESNCGH